MVKSNDNWLANVLSSQWAFLSSFNEFLYIYSKYDKSITIKDNTLNYL